MLRFKPHEDFEGKVEGTITIIFRRSWTAVRDRAAHCGVQAVLNLSCLFYLSLEGRYYLVLRQDGVEGHLHSHSQKAKHNIFLFFSPPKETTLKLSGM